MHKNKKNNRESEHKQEVVFEKGPGTAGDCARPSDPRSAACVVTAPVPCASFSGHWVKPRGDSVGERRRTRAVTFFPLDIRDPQSIFSILSLSLSFHIVQLPALPLSRLIPDCPFPSASSPTLPLSLSSCFQSASRCSPLWRWRLRRRTPAACEFRPLYEAQAQPLFS